MEYLNSVLLHACVHTCTWLLEAAIYMEKPISSGARQATCILRSLDTCTFLCSYSRMAYCDVTGRESRLPLKMRSQGIGPHLLFSFDTLDIQNVFINSAHAYEVLSA